MTRKKIDVYTPEQMAELLKAEGAGVPGESSADGSEAQAEAGAAAPAESAAADADLEALLKKAELADEYLDALQRKQAEFENYRRRVQREQEEMRLTAERNLVVDLLEVADAFKRAMESAESLADPQAKAFASGVELVEKKLWDSLSRRGVERIAAQGEDFDPALHEALMPKHEPDRREGEVLAVLREGYLMQGRVLRPAGVIVNQGAGEG